LTFGLAFLETTANPYILAMGDKSTATQRLNLAQAFNPLGLILGLLVAQQFVLKKLQSDNITDFSTLEEAKKIMIRTADLMVIRDPYVILGLVVMAVFVLIAISKMPQAKDDGDMAPLKSTFSSLFENENYRNGVLSQVLYVGAQIMCWTYIYQYAEAIGISSQDAANYQFICFIVFLVGRAIGTYLLRFVNAGKLLFQFAIMAGICVLGTVFIKGIVGLYALVAISFFMSLMFPTIYGIALEDLDEKESKIGAAGLVMAIVGGALMPKLQGMIIDLGGSGVADTTIMGVSEVNFSFLLPFLCFIFIAFYGKKVFNQAK
jgi:FHS family L-fucose permease-like MFS transporter